MTGRRLVSDERGITLIEVLVAAALMVVVLAAVLSTLDAFASGVAKHQRRTDAQQQARSGIDQVARQLRNLASPTPGRPEAVDRAQPYDLVFQAVDPTGPNAGANAANVRRLRYCLDDTGVVWQQTQTWTQAQTPPVPATTACPGADPAWTGAQGVVAGVVNRAGGQDRPLFSYDSATLTEVSFVRATVHVDPDPAAPGASTLSTGVFLRNQNRVPAAAFTATVTGDRHVLLNGTASTDPEGQPLTYAWFDGATQVGTGVTFDYAAPAAGLRSLTLQVTDPGGLRAQAQAQEVDVR